MGGVLAFLITIPIFFRGVEFNILESGFIYIGACVVALVHAQKVNRCLRNKHLFVLTIGLWGLFLVYILAGILYCESTETVLKVFFKWLEIIIIGLFVFIFINSPRRFSYFYWLLFLVNMALVIEALFHAGFSTNHIFVVPRIRIGAETVYAIALALPFVAKKGFKFLLAGLMLIVLFSQSRASWLELVAILLLFAYHMKDNRKLLRKAAILMLLLFCGIVFVPAGRDVVYKRVSHLGVFGNKPAFSTYQRLYRLEACYYAFLDHPVLGVGAGNIFYYTEKTGKASILDWAEKNHKKSITPHNVYAEQLAETGLIGVTLFISILGSLYKIITCVRRNEKFRNAPEAMGIYLHFAVFIIFLSFGYIAGTTRITMGIYIGLILAMLKWPVFYPEFRNFQKSIRAIKKS